MNVRAAPAPDTHRLSYRDDEIVVRFRQGENAMRIATVLGHPHADVCAALARAQAAGVTLWRTA